MTPYCMVQRQKRHSTGLDNFLIHLGILPGRHDSSRSDGNDRRKKATGGRQQGSEQKKPTELFYKTSHGLQPASGQIVR